MKKNVPALDAASKRPTLAESNAEELRDARGRALLEEAKSPRPTSPLWDALEQYRPDLRLEPEWASLKLNAVHVIWVALNAIDNPTAQDAAVLAAMARATNENQGAASATARAMIRQVVSLSAVKKPRSPSAEYDAMLFAATEGYPDGQSDEGRPENAVQRVAFLRAELGKIHPCLHLDEASATRLVDRFGERKNGERALAANWAWLAGFQTPGNKPKAGRATAAFVARFDDTARKRVSRKRRSDVKKRAG